MCEGLPENGAHGVDERLFDMINSPRGDIDHINVSGWMDQDEPENKILRSILTVVGYYEKARL